MQLICHVDDIPHESSKGFILEDQSIFAVKKDGVLHVYKNQCPHLNIELEWQPDQFLDADNYFIQCATHGALFEVESGDCVSGPCQGDKLIKLETKIENDQLYARLP